MRGFQRNPMMWIEREDYVEPTTLTKALLGRQPEVLHLIFFFQFSYFLSFRFFFLLKLTAGLHRSQTATAVLPPRSRSWQIKASRGYSKPRPRFQNRNRGPSAGMILSFHLKKIGDEPLFISHKPPFSPHLQPSPHLKPSPLPQPPISHSNPTIPTKSTIFIIQSSRSHHH